MQALSPMPFWRVGPAQAPESKARTKQPRRSGVRHFHRRPVDIFDGIHGADFTGSSGRSRGKPTALGSSCADLARNDNGDISTQHISTSTDMATHGQPADCSRRILVLSRGLVAARRCKRAADRFTALEHPKHPKHPKQFWTVDVLIPEIPAVLRTLGPWPLSYESALNVYIVCIGQTKRQLCTRSKEHQIQVFLGKKENSALPEHTCHWLG